MPLSSLEIKRIRRVIAILEKVIADSPRPRIGRPPLGLQNAAVRQSSRGKRIRRTGRELVAFRKMLKAERKKGVPVARLAKEHGISSAYIYLLPK